MKIFLSFTTREKEFANRLSEALRAAGHEPVSIDLQITYGGQLDKKILKGSPGFDYVIVLLSQAHAESDWLQNEMLAFIALEKLRETKIIFPVIVEDSHVPLYFRDRIAADFRGTTFEAGVSQLLQKISTSQKAFVVMRFGDPDLDSAYAGVIEPVLTNFFYTVTRIDKVQNGEEINDQVKNEILGSALVLADLTGERPNCYYEAGYAHALGKTVILTARTGTLIHFDLSTHRFIYWKNEQDFREQLKRRLEEMKE